MQEGGGSREGMAEFQRHHQGVAEKVVGKSRKRGQRRTTSWWNEEVKSAVRRKKELYNRALGEKSERAWEDYMQCKLQ